MVFDEPSGAACMPGGVWPCGLSAGAPPVLVFRGPVGPCGCFSPLFSGGETVVPVLCGEGGADLSTCPVCADTMCAQAHIKALRLTKLSFASVGGSCCAFAISVWVITPSLFRSVALNFSAHSASTAVVFCCAKAGMAVNNMAVKMAVRTVIVSGWEAYLARPSAWTPRRGSRALWFLRAKRPILKGRLTPHFCLAKYDEWTEQRRVSLTPCSVRLGSVLVTNASAVTSPPVAAASSYGTTLVVAAAPWVVATIVTEGDTHAVATVVAPIIDIPTAFVRERTQRSLVVWRRTTAAAGASRSRAVATISARHSAPTSVTCRCIRGGTTATPWRGALAATIWRGALATTAWRGVHAAATTAWWGAGAAATTSALVLGC